jgi:predicted kinase
MTGNRLILVCGLSFAGKSTLADAMCAEFGWAQVDVDDTKDELHGEGVADADLSPDDWDRIYAETDRRMEEQLSSGRTVVDASRNFRRHERDHARVVAQRAGADVIVVYVDAPVAVVRERWARNVQTRSRRHVTEEGFEDILSAMERPGPDEDPVVFPHDADLRDWLARHAECLGGKLQS